MVEELNKIDTLVLVLLILLIGAYLGASYSDENWKHDLKDFSQHNTKFQFDHSEKYYLIQSHNLSVDYSKINLSDITIEKD